MGISRDKWHKRRKTGGKRKQIRSKRKFEIGRQPAMTRLGERRVHSVRGHGGFIKFKALKLDHGNYSWPGEAISRKTRIIGVVYNPSNAEYVRTNTLVKGSVIQVDATPFKNWYQKHYGVVVGKEVPFVRPKKVKRLKRGEKPKKEKTHTKAIDLKKSATVEKKGTEKKGPEKKGTEKKGTEKKGTEKKGTEKKGAEKKGTEKKGTEKKPTEKKPTEKKPTEKPTEKKPVEKKPTEKKPVEKKPVEKKPVEKKPVEKKPVEKKPVEKKSTEKKPAEKQSTEKKQIKKPTEKKPTEKKPTEGVSKSTQEKKTKGKKKPPSSKHTPSSRMKKKWRLRNVTRVLEPAISEQFDKGRLYAKITTSPGQVGTADGYILEGEELAFYIKKMALKKKK